MLCAILFDFIGTTVKEKDPEIVNNCFEKAFAENNVPVEMSFLKKQRGKDKKLIIEEILRLQNMSLSLQEKIYSSFISNLKDNIDQFCENDGAKEIFSFLKKRNIRIGIGTGLSRNIFKEICIHLAWKMDSFDYIGITSEMKRSRPHPDMIFDMMKKLRITEPNEILKIGDTIADIKEGKNAGTLTAVILSGTQNEKDLLKEKPDFVLRALTEIKEIIG